MLRPVVIAVSLVLMCATAASAQRVRAARFPFPDFSRVLVVTAHPDDEALLAPLLGAWCAEGRSECSLLVMTRGESGACALAEGCGSDLGATRAAELGKSAALLGVELEVWDFPDVMDDVTRRWDAHASTHEALLARIGEVIEHEKPSAVITFDPAHGSSCHPAHRAIGSIVREVMSQQTSPPVYFLETRVEFDGDTVRLRRALQYASSIFLFDATESWHYLTDVGRLHASQFTPAQLDSLADPEQLRSIVLMPASAAPTARHEALCP